MTEIILLLNDIRSTHNVGSLLRTAECMGVNKVIFTGYTPYPQADNDKRLPHIVRKLNKDIAKTALGTETMISWKNENDITSVIKDLRDKNYQIIALEQNPRSIPLSNLEPADKVALLIGSEVEGVDPPLLALCDTIVEIPQYGKKESLNVVQATAIALYALRC